ncbi:MAG: hypothetical protein A3A24_03695 [Candidatus Buchananbacteria bacterium RIFCSPLOWO2_01_FULL_46_12]|uniref:Uncharacterized protein n=2 Tax=Candidatus Buchananiibacteriota TaxID=1817903 RepID=A0A1G1YT35_9BACT|nr:MAG: hypothetical protein A2744_01900 [Candidatus Buchananbacteria bacterium RIFCSPHIGHO2_01_FULL_44_11]OGY55532.1 MAG: hypothetical protein A3A24_03695 [Candidatus Buchananbacteria bacterium RIFCSPLOWO2_01_FULL_46_12]
MKRQLGIIIAFILEVSLLLVVLIFLLLGIVGIFLPIIPGLVLVGFAVAIYTFLLKNEKNQLSHRFHRYLLKFKSRFNRLTNNRIYMGIIKTIKKRRAEAIQRTIVRYGLILFSFNFTLILFLFFLLMGLTTAAFLLSLSVWVIAFVPLFVIFLFAATASIIWYRFGQILRSVFQEKLILYSGLVVLISVLPLLLILFFLSLIISVFSFSGSSLLPTIFLVTLLVTVLAVIFEIFIVTIGAVTKD